MVVIKVIMSFLRSSARQSEEKEYWQRKAKDEVLAVENEVRKIKVTYFCINQKSMNPLENFFNRVKKNKRSSGKEG